MTSHPYPAPQRRTTNSLGAGASAMLFAFLTSGCVVTPDENTASEDHAQEPSPPVGYSPPHEGTEEADALASSITTSTWLGNNLQIDVIALERLENDILRLRLKIINKSGETVQLRDGLGEPGDQYTASAITLIDSENKQRYLSYDQSDGSCLCQTLGGQISGGASEALWVAFPTPPDDLESMTITTPLTPPIFDVPISESSETVDSQELANPVILDLTMISDDLENQTGRTENNEEVSILLSSDVLFETNSSDLSGNAWEILEQVAQEINDATATSVSVDGYADNTGSDSVNEKLSLERAQTVESTLSGMVTRDEVSYEVNGHGSNDPIADNSTEEGRERNRRVSITFEK
ncbi:OmpA family protein [Nocardiopsis sp. FIRDI 009]|uniref:OmpA family protein n=1 Tax=Nocardiopsis sp. FIRDI 009 TaxID=714197 RepID=UPI001E38F73B|nr:OmpA family protein [Nocardiopsis sp. FIRDI 009]